MQLGLDIDLSGRTALVCGASQGIGEATAHLLASMGASVVVLARNHEKLEALVKSLPVHDREQKHQWISADVSNRVALKEKIETILGAHGVIEILVCNTGGPKSGPITEASDEQFLDAFQNHILVNSLLVKLLLPGMKTRGFGRVINVISTSVRMPIPGLGVSNTIRAAVASWAKTLSLEVAPFGVTVNNVLPGYTETPRLKSLLEAAAKNASVSEDVMADRWKQMIPMGRFGKPEEIASAIAFFASPAAGYITGTSLASDGGRTGAL